MDSIYKAQQRHKGVGRWLLLGVVMIIIQILLGGITRLTGSGLSITEWKPLLGAIPPLSEEKWQLAFQHYKQIAQFKILNHQFSLSDFKGIYFWEWLHREWGRLLGVVFLVGFIWFLVRRQLNNIMILPFVILFILGGLQGLVGWVMVQSGLNETDLFVSHYFLAAHFIAALLLLCYVLWFALLVLVPGEKQNNKLKGKGLLITCISVLVLQLVYGAFMAGLKAAASAPSWPSINGTFLPPHFTEQSVASHPLNVQFIHRMLAYILVVLIALWYGNSYKNRIDNKFAARVKPLPLILVLLQVLLGIFTVLNASTIKYRVFGTFEYLALWHQLIAIFLLMSLIANLFLYRKAYISK